nr:hypothetical protein [Kocuria sp. TGY1127_2]
MSPEPNEAGAVDIAGRLQYPGEQEGVVLGTLSAITDLHSPIR